jgi:serine/threonine-protein kinase HipA
MNYLKVILWGTEIGRLYWDTAKRCSYFAFNPKIKDRCDVSPLLLPKGKTSGAISIPGDTRHLYQGLPPFIADSLPDSWGNTLFERWTKDNLIPRNQITPLYKLMFIGTRGMGALEYEPAAEDLNRIRQIDIKSLYNIALQILDERRSVSIIADEKLSLQTLLAVGTSAGGRQMKAVIALNPTTGEIRSGQSDNLTGYDYCLLKFGSSEMPTAEIEMAYYEMARYAGINMEKCQLLNIDGINHFVTSRFDRKDGRKIHTQTLAAINPEVTSYEGLIDTCRELKLSENDIEDVFRRMVFNIMANNTDDHNKNFAFTLAEDGEWQLAPAYDITFIFNTRGNNANDMRCLSINGKYVDITIDDIIKFANENDIANATHIIDRIAVALQQFPAIAARYQIAHRWGSIIHSHLKATLAEYGYINNISHGIDFMDNHGRQIKNFKLNVNSKGHYEVTAVIDGVAQRRFLRPTTAAYAALQRAKLDVAEIDIYKQIVDTIF